MPSIAKPPNSLCPRHEPSSCYGMQGRSSPTWMSSPTLSTPLATTSQKALDCIKSPLLREWSYAPVDAIAVAMSIKPNPTSPPTTPSTTSSNTPYSSPASFIDMEPPLTASTSKDHSPSQTPVRASPIRGLAHENPLAEAAALIPRHYQQALNDKIPVAMAVANLACNLRHSFDQIGQSLAQATNAPSNNSNPITDSSLKNSSPDSACSTATHAEPSRSRDSSPISTRSHEETSGANINNDICISQPSISVQSRDEGVSAPTEGSVATANATGQIYAPTAICHPINHDPGSHTLRHSQSMPILCPTDQDEEFGSLLQYDERRNLSDYLPEDHEPCPNNPFPDPTSPTKQFTLSPAARRMSHSSDDYVVVDGEYLPSALEMNRYSAEEDERCRQSIEATMYEPAMFDCFMHFHGCVDNAHLHNSHHSRVCGPVPVVRKSVGKLRKWIRQHKQRRQQARRERRNGGRDVEAPPSNYCHSPDQPHQGGCAGNNTQGKHVKQTSEPNINPFTGSVLPPCWLRHPCWRKCDSCPDDGLTVTTAHTTQSKDELDNENNGGNRKNNLPRNRTQSEPHDLAENSKKTSRRADGRGDRKREMLRSISVTRSPSSNNTLSGKEQQSQRCKDKKSKVSRKMKRKHKKDKGGEKNKPSRPAPVEALILDKNTACHCEKNTTNVPAVQAVPCEPPSDAIGVGRPLVAKSHPVFTSHPRFDAFGQMLVGSLNSHDSAPFCAAAFFSALTEKINQQNALICAMSEKIGQFPDMPLPSTTHDRLPEKPSDEATESQDLEPIGQCRPCCLASSSCCNGCPGRDECLSGENRHNPPLTPATPTSSSTPSPPPPPPPPSNSPQTLNESLHDVGHESDHLGQDPLLVEAEPKRHEANFVHEKQTTGAPTRTNFPVADPPSFRASSSQQKVMNIFPTVSSSQLQVQPLLDSHNSSVALEIERVPPDPDVMEEIDLSDATVGDTSSKQWGIDAPDHTPSTPLNTADASANVPIKTNAKATIPGDFPSVKGRIQLFETIDQTHYALKAINLAAALKWRNLICRSRLLILADPSRLGEERRRPDPPEEGVAEARKYPIRLSRGNTPISSSSSFSSTSPLKRKKSLLYNDKLKVVFVGAPSSGKSSVVHGLQQLGLSNSGFRKSKACLKKRSSSIGVDVPLFPPTTSSPDFSEKIDHVFEPILNDRCFQRKNSDGCGSFTLSLWDFPGGDCRDGGSCHSEKCRYSSSCHAKQSLFFSSDSLFVLVWDMGVNNPDTWMRRRLSSDIDDDFFLQENVSREADRALERDIDNKVLFWIDCIRKSDVERVSVLPVATFADRVNEIGGPHEATRRCEIMKRRLVLHYELGSQTSSRPFPTLFFGFGRDSKLSDDGVILINALENRDVDLLREKIGILAKGLSSSTRSSLGIVISDLTQSVWNIVKCLKSQGLRIVEVEHILAQVKDFSHTDEWVQLADIKESLRFLSNTGEILYFESSGNDVPRLSQFCLLCPKFLFGAVSCIVRRDLRRELMEARRFLNEQLFVSRQVSHEKYSASGAWNSNSNSITVTSEDLSMLWGSMSFMKNAIELGSKHTSPVAVYQYLECLFVHHGIVIPINKTTFNYLQPSQSNLKTEQNLLQSPPSSDSPCLPNPQSETLFLLPNLLEPEVPPEIWTYKTRDAWKTTIAHTWLFRESAAPDLMVTALSRVLQNLFSSKKCSFECLSCPRRSEPNKVITIHSVKCWKNGFRLDLSTGIENNGYSVVNIFGHLVSSDSPYCVASNSMTSGMRKLILSAKGQVGNGGDKIWTGGYSLVMDAIKSVIESLCGAQIGREVVCPDCLADFPIRDASVWRDEEICHCSKLREQGRIWCQRGHSIDAGLVTGITKRNSTPQATARETPSFIPLSNLVDAVVIVGLWDSVSMQIRNVGSGFIVDKKRGLIVTASHVLIEMGSNKNFGKDYFGLDGKAVIGVLPKESGGINASTNKGNGTNSAVFRYMAEIIAKDVANTDACVLRITTKLEQDVGGNGAGCRDQPEIPLLNNAAAFKREKLKHLNLRMNVSLMKMLELLGSTREVRAFKNQECA